MLSIYRVYNFENYIYIGKLNTYNILKPKTLIND